MNPVHLDSGDYGGSYKLIGEEVSLDFINTISWPGTAQEHDWLDRPENVTAWAVAAGVINEYVQGELDARLQTPLTKELRRVKDIRSNLNSILKPLAYDEQPAISAVETLTKLVHQISEYRYIDPERYQWRWAKPSTLTEVLNPVIWNAAHVLTGLDHSRIGHCPTCEWVFYDTTRNRSRKWCDMKDCGSRHKALRYYHRTKSTDNP